MTSQGRRADFFLVFNWECVWEGRGGEVFYKLYHFLLRMACTILLFKVIVIFD